mmetsp:Transcript_29653/g.61847  ORF Transcript_29653/g.61847 Transcript_29653/m.61847 type:complete len:268 (+) Transcript_29653:3983-4786(+)
MNHRHHSFALRHNPLAPCSLVFKKIKNTNQCFLFPSIHPSLHPSFLVPFPYSYTFTCPSLHNFFFRHRHRIDHFLSLGFLAPLVLFPDRRFFLWRKVVGDVEGLTDFLGRLSLDHRSDSRAGKIQERLDVHVVRRQNELEQQDLLEVDKVGVPLLHDVGHVAGLEGFLDLRHGFRQVVVAELDDLAEDLALDVRQRDLGDLVVVVVVVVVIVVVVVVVHHRLDEFRHVGHRQSDGEFVSLFRDQLNGSCRIPFVTRFDIHGFISCVI